MVSCQTYSKFQALFGVRQYCNHHSDIHTRINTRSKKFHTENVSHMMLILSRLIFISGSSRVALHQASIEKTNTKNQRERDFD